MNRKDIANLIAKLRAEEVSPRVLERGRERLLMAMKSSEGVSRRATFSVFHPRAFSLAVSFALVVILVSAGFVVASQNALPGDALYSVKRTSERMQLAVAGDLPERVALQVSFFDRRLEEAQSLMDRDGGIAVQEEVRIALNESHKYLTEAQVALEQLSEDNSDESRAAIDVFEGLAARQEENLERLSDSDPSLRSSVAAVTVELLEVEKQAVLADVPKSEEPMVVAVPLAAEQVVASAEGDVDADGDVYAELREKARIKINLAKIKRDEISLLTVEFRSTDYDEYRDALVDLDERFNLSVSFIDLAVRELADEEYGSSFSAAVDSIKMLTNIESDALNLIDIIIASAVDGGEGEQPVE